MEKEKVEQLANLTSELHERMVEIIPILKNCEKYRDIEYLEGYEFSMCIDDTNPTNNMEVFGEGDGPYCMGEGEHYNFWIPAKYLWMSEDDLKQEVKKIREEEEKRKKKQEEQRKKYMEEREREQYEKLKLKFG